MKLQAKSHFTCVGQRHTGNEHGDSLPSPTDIYHIPVENTLINTV